MAYTVIARRYRPQSFDEVIGQEHVTTTLKNAILSDRVHHAYLFAGPRGVGKTSTARILSKALSCQKGLSSDPCNHCEPCRQIAQSSFLDVLEIDGASNRGIDEIRTLRENVKYAPAMGRFKIYIIDEVHQVTPPAFNALLKTLEEPPPHVRFIFATTEPHRIPATILSRCQRFDFRLVDAARMLTLLKEIAKKEKLKIEDSALYRLARAAKGSIRDGESILDQLVNFSQGIIRSDDVTRLLGTLDAEFWFEYLSAVRGRDVGKAWSQIDRMLREGADPNQFGLGLADFLRDLLVARLGKPVRSLLELPDDEVKKMQEFASEFSQGALIGMIDRVGEAQGMMRRALAPRIALEVLTVKLAHGDGTVSVDEILDRLEGRHEEPPPAQDRSRVRSHPARETQAPERPSEHVTKGVEAQTVEDESEAPLVFGVVQQAWDRILAKTRERKMSAGTYLAEANLVAVQGRTLVIGFPQNLTFHKETLERKENLEIVLKSSEALLGAPVRIEMVTLKNLQEKRNKTARGGEPDHPVVESALKLFGGRILSTEHPS